MFRARRKHPLSDDERGVVAVEFALVVPLVLALFVGVVFFAHLGWVRIQLNGAVHALARSCAIAAAKGAICSPAQSAQFIRHEIEPSCRLVGFDARPVPINASDPAAGNWYFVVAHCNYTGLVPKQIGFSPQLQAKAQVPI